MSDYWQGHRHGHAEALAAVRVALTDLRSDPFFPTLTPEQLRQHVLDRVEGLSKEKPWMPPRR